MKNFQFPLEVTGEEFNQSWLEIVFFEYIILSNDDIKSVKPFNTDNASSSGYGENVVINPKAVGVLSAAQDGIMNAYFSNEILDLTTQRKPILSGIVKLPLPKVINNTNNITWSDTDMSLINVLSTSAENIQKAGGEEKFVNVMSQLWQAWTIGNKKENSSSVMNYAKTAVADMTDQSYAGVTKRNLNFSWEFVVKTRKEAQALKALIDFIEMRVLAQAAKTNVGLDNFFLTYPDSVNLYFIRNGKENEYLPRYEDMVVEMFEVAYGDDSANGFYTLEDGEPIVVKITMTFKEKVARLRDSSNSIKKQRSNILEKIEE